MMPKFGFVWLMQTSENFSTFGFVLLAPFEYSSSIKLVTFINIILTKQFIQYKSILLDKQKC